MAVNLGKGLPTISHHNNLEKGKGDKNYYDSGKNDTTTKIKMIVMIMMTAMVIKLMILATRLWVWGGLKSANTAAVFPPGTVWL